MTDCHRQIWHQARQRWIQAATRVWIAPRAVVCYRPDDFAADSRLTRTNSRLYIRRAIKIEIPAISMPAAAKW